MSAVVAISATQPFAYNQSRDPWRGAQDFCPYSEDDNDGIIQAVNRVCRFVQRFAVVPVLKDYGSSYYVVVTRSDLDVNVIQARVDFSPTGKYEVRERPVLVPDWTKRLYQRLKFDSTRLSVPALASLFWDPLRVECIARCDGMLLKTPSPVPFLVNVSFYSGRNCFNATVHQANDRVWVHGDGFRLMLSVVLQEAMARPSKRFACVLPLVPDEERFNQRRYVGVLREGESTDINVVLFDGIMKQFKTVFSTGVPPVPAATIPQIPGFNLVSRRLTGDDKDVLMQRPVFMHWTKSVNHITPVGSSLGLFAEPAYDFHYDRQTHPGLAAMLVALDAFASRKTQEGVAFVCCSGGPQELLVPLHAHIPPVGQVLSFLVIHREVLRVTTFVSEELFLIRYSSYPTVLSQGFKDTLPRVVFDTRPAHVLQLEQTLILDVIRTVWTQRIDQLIVIQHPRIAVTGVKFEYLVPWTTRGVMHSWVNGVYSGIKSFPPIAAERVERVIRAMCADTGIGSSLVPVGEIGPNSYVAAVRDGVNVRIGFISQVLVAAAFFEPLRSLDLDLPNIIYMPFIDQQHITMTPAIVRDLYEQPLFSHWQHVAETNPHNWTPRATALVLATHPRVGGRAPMRVLDAELLAMVARLCLQ